MDVVENRATRGGQSDCTAGPKKDTVHDTICSARRNQTPVKLKKNKLGMTTLEDGKH